MMESPALNVTLALLSFVWFFIGLAGAIYWRTKHHPITNDGGELLGCIVFSLMGPFTWIVGWMIAGDFWARPRVVIPQRPWVKKPLPAPVQKEKK